MRKRGVLLVAAMAVIGCVRAHAVTNVEEVADFNALRAYTGTAAHVIVDARDSHGSTLNGDGGGGEFFQKGTVAGGNCAANVGGVGDDDDGVVIVGTGSGTQPCWYRQFWGPVHLAWYGVPDAASSGCYGTQAALEGQACAADNVLRTDSPAPPATQTYINAVANAFSAANSSNPNIRPNLPGADGGVVTDGRSIAISNGPLEIPPTQYLSCSISPAARRPAEGGLKSRQPARTPSPITRCRIQLC